MSHRTLGQWIVRELKYYALALPIVAGGWFLYNKRKQQQFPAELAGTMRDAREARAAGDLGRAAAKYGEAAQKIDTLFEARAGQGKARGGGGGSAAEIGTQFRVAAARGQVFEEDGDAAAAARHYDRAVALRKRQRKKLRWERRRAKLQRQEERKAKGMPEIVDDRVVPLMTNVPLPWLDRPTRTTPEGNDSDAASAAGAATTRTIRPLNAKSPLDPDLAAVLDRLAGIAQAQRNFADAERLYVQALGALATPKEVAAVMTAASAVGAVSNAAEVATAAAAAAAAAATKAGDALQRDTVRCAATAGVLFNLHSVYLDAGRQDDATAILQRSLAVCNACGRGRPGRPGSTGGTAPPDCSPILRLLASYKNAAATDDDVSVDSSIMHNGVSVDSSIMHNTDGGGGGGTENHHAAVTATATVLPAAAAIMPAALSADDAAVMAAGLDLQEGGDGVAPDGGVAPGDE